MFQCQTYKCRINANKEGKDSLLKKNQKNIRNFFMTIIFKVDASLKN